MPVADRWSYLDHAAVSPLTAPAREVVRRWMNESTEHGIASAAGWYRRVEEVRQLGARLIGADEDELALVHNTTAGIGIVAEGFPWQEGDNVVTLANEFPSNLYPWMNLESRGVQTRRVAVDHGRVDLDRIADSCDERTRIVAASWVGFASGWRCDVAALAAMAHDQGALLFLDAIQGVGVFPLDVNKAGVDFLAADGHKWMLGPEGAGFLYIRRAHLDLVHATGVGWHSVVHDGQFDRIELELKPSASRFEGGTENVVGVLALGASLELLESCGIDQIGERVLGITDYACQQLAAAGATIESPREGDHRSGIVSFTWPGDMALLRRRLLDDGVVVSHRCGCLRISPHAYNNEADIERLVAALQQSE